MSYSVFVVDDDPALLRLSAMVLKLDGYAVSSFSSPVAALHEIESPAGALPDAIVLDLSMPEMDGREFYQRLRTAGCMMPVVIVSAYGAESAKETLGAQAALKKPFLPDDLTYILKDLLSRYAS